MALIRVEPKTSKKIGNVILDLYGLNFVTDGLEIGIDQSYSSSVGTIDAVVEYQSDGISFYCPEQIGQKAIIELNETFNEAYDLEFPFEILPKSMPLVDKAKLLGVSCIDSTNALNKVSFYITYEKTKGYLLKIETIESSVIQDIVERSIDPNVIESIGVRACGKYIHGFIKVSGERLYFGKSSAVNFSTSKIQVFSSTPETGLANELEVKIKNIEYIESVSFVGYPTEIISWQDRKIQVRTFPGEISLGDIIIALSDGTTTSLENYGRYVQGSGVKSFNKSFDTIQAIYAEHISPSRGKLFSSTKGFVWGRDYFLADSEKNNNLYVPSLWDPMTGNIPQSFFQSGIGRKKDLEFLGIKKNIAEDKEKWHPKINHGTYFIANVPYFLFSDESIIEYLGEEKTSDGRSIHPLLYPPKPGIPIVASSLGEEPSTKSIIERKRLQKRGKFSGQILNGVELDTTDTSNIDQTKEEFIVIYNNNNEIKNWKIPTEGTLAGKYTFSLPETPLLEYSLRFSRPDLFVNEKIIARKYGEEVFGHFQYGEGVIDPGDYAIDYANSTVEVILDRPYKDLGLLSYTFDYPAIIEFNADYTEDKGVSIESPSFSDLRDLDNLGESNGEAGQKFRLYDFPIIDKSTLTSIDQNNFKLFIYNEYDNSFDTSWTRVSDFSDSGPSDSVYKVEPSKGIVTFGDGINGKIPGKYLNILAAYKPTLKIQYEPDSSNDYWLGKTIDLNLTKQNINSGFLYVTRKELTASSVELEFTSENVNAYETTELNVTVYTREGEVVPNTKVFFELLTTGGAFQEETLVTDSNGKTSTIFNPSSKLADIGIKIDCFEAGEEEGAFGTKISSTYGDENGIPYMSLNAGERIQGKIEEIYLFKILDDGDHFLPYNNMERTGGRMVVYNDGSEPIRGSYLAGTVIGFENQLPQPFDPDGPNYEPNLRGFYLVGKKTVQARAYVEVDGNRIYSDIITLTVEYSPLQKGIWKLPTPPIDYESSQIDTATYISI